MEGEGSAPQAHPFDAIFDAADAGLCLVGPDGRVLRVNAAWRRLTGLESASLAWRPLSEQAPDVAEIAAGVLASAGAAAVPVPPHRRDIEGNEVWREGAVAPIALPDGWGALITLREATAAVLLEREQQRAAALAQRLELLEAAIEQMPAGVVIADGERGLTLLGNRLAEDIWRLPLHPPDGMIPYELYQGFHPDGRRYRPSEWPVMRSIRQGETVMAEEIAILRGDGTSGVIRVNSAPIRTRDGQIVAGAVTLLDITERKRIEDDLRRSEERFRISQELSLDAFTILHSVRDAAGAIVDFVWDYVNPTAARLLLHPAEELVGRRLLEVLPGNRDGGLFGAYVRVVETGQAHDMELPYQAEGIDGWFRNMTVKLEDGVAIFFSDITERKRIEDDLRRSEAHFRTLFESPILGIFTATMQGFTDANDAFLRIIGYDRDDLKAGLIQWRRITPPEYRAWDEQMLAALRVSGSFLPFEKEYIHKDSSRVPVLIGAALLEASPLTWICFVLDISERKRAEESSHLLAESGKALTASMDFESTLQSVASLALSSLADWCSVWIEEADGEVYEFVTAGAGPEALPEPDPPQRRRLDRSSAHPVAEALRRGEPVLYPEAAADALTDSADRPEREETTRRQDAPSIIIVPMQARGRTLGAIGFLRTQPGRRYDAADLALAQEIGQRAALALDNARLYRLAQEAVRIRDEFLAVAAHDLRNPLTTIKGTAQLLRRRVARMDGPETERLREGLRTIEATTNRMATQINELLDITRLEMGQPLALDLRPTDLAALAFEVAGEQQQAAERPRLWVTARSAGLVGVWDRARLERVLDNLLNNALKYSPDSSEVTVTLSREADERGVWAVMQVQDRGVGIPAADLPHIFERFRRGSNVVGQFAGAGLGLAGSRRVIEQHGGVIALESQEGGGTTVTVRLPLPSENAGVPPR